MTLPARIGPPAARAQVIGIYFAWYYIGMAVAPPLAGAFRAAAGVAAPLWLAPVSLGLAIATPGLFVMSERRSAAAN